MNAVVLAIETSCDETAIAVLGEDGLLASEIASQTALHQKYGGVVPEVASRNHLIKIQPLLVRVLERIPVEQVNCVSATRGPGLLTSLLIGYSTAKGLAIGLDKPFIGINHLEGHLLSPFFGESAGPRPSVGLIVSGGHTLLVHCLDVSAYRLLGSTLDDAAGEAFDKVARLLGLPYPGGPVIDRLAKKGDPARYELPRSMPGNANLDFSFSGLKTAVRYLLPKLTGDFLADLCASFQEAVVDVLARKTVAAAKQVGADLMTVSGGVSCNSRLREKMTEAAEKSGLALKLADPILSTDNAAMIAYAAQQRFNRGYRSDLDEDADPNLRLV